MYAYLLVVSVVLIPSLKLSPNVPSLRLEDFLTVAAILWLLLSGRVSAQRLLGERHLRVVAIPMTLLLCYLLVLTAAVSVAMKRGDLLPTINKSLGVFRGLLVTVAMFHMIKSQRQAERVSTS